VLPRASYWGWVVANPANDQVVEIPALPKDGPLGWWAKAVGVTTYDPRRGAGTRIGVVDTGVGPHPYLSHVEGVGSQVNGVFTAGRKAALDVDEHGTHVSGILAARPVDESRDFAGLAPGASVFVVRVFPEGGGASQGDIAEAIDLLSVQHEVDLINLSLGSPSPSEIERDAIAHAAERGTLCVAAAGNSFGQPVFYPAAYEIVASVAAIGITGSCPNGSVASRSYPPLSPQGMAGNAYVANFCNAGPSLFCCAPGVGIISTAPARHVAPAPYIDLSGTSMAAPMACAALATQLAADAEYLAMPRNLARAQRASAVLNATLRRLGFPQALGGRGLSQAR
jgi:subtilisin family serine protease